jgi:predicted NAD/FAD-dependent oxidoreductase
VGGRIATRRMGSTFVNHGAEEFQVSHPILKTLVEIGVKENLLQVNNQMALPIGNLNQWIKILSKDLNLIKENEISSFEKKDHTFLLKNKNEDTVLECDRIILCVPAPQAMQLLKNSGLSFNFLQEISYKAQIQFFFLIKSPLPSELEEGKDYFLKKKQTFNQDHFLYHFEIKDESISRFLDLDKDQIAQYFLNILNVSKDEIVEWHSHKWRYSRVQNTLPPENQFTLQNENIYLAGDYFYGDDFNSAMKSVEAIKKVLLKSSL